MKLPLIQWLIQGIPECIALVFFGLVLLEKRLNIKKALILGLIQAIIIYLVRLFPLPFGIHTLIAIISLSILLLYSSGGRYSKALIISFFVNMVLGLSELAILPAASYLLNMPLESIFNQPLLFALVSLPQVFVLILIAFLVNLFHNKRKKHNGKNFQGAN
jgi:hypothetical protein